MNDELLYLVLTAFDQTSGKNYTSSKALELLAKVPNPAAIQDYKQRTLLHHACWNGWLDVVRALVERYRCDPNAVDDVGSTPLHWACHGSTEIVKYLVKKALCVPASCRNRYGSTPLHWACRSKQPDIEMVRFLVEEQHCDPSAVEAGGNTPLHAACVGGSLEVVQFLLKDARCDASCRNDNGETLLHKASQEGHYDLVKYLVMERGCNPSAKDNDKETPLHLASGGGYLNIAQYLCLETSCDPNSKTSEDLTPLHKACIEGRTSVVRFLVTQCKCNALKTNRKGESPFTLACLYEHVDVVVFLLTAIDLERAPDMVSRILSSDVVRGVLACKRDHPLHPAFKLFVVGNPSAGKSTLVKTLQNKLLHTTRIKSIGAQFSNVKGVELKTAGIIPVHVDNPKEGHIIMYDFAGQHEYYSSHAAVMENLASAPGSLVLIVVDLSRDIDEIKQCLSYWSSFMHNLSARSASRPQLAIVGSHADVVKSYGEQPSIKLSDACKELEDLSATAKIALNCKRLASAGLNVLFDLISSHAKKFQKRFDLDLQAFFVNAVIKQKLSDKIACHFSDIVALTSSDENSHLRRYDLLPEGDESLEHHLTTLSEHGQLLFLKNDIDVSKSWVILNKEVLLSEINGVLFAPAYFKQHQHVSTPSGIVPFSKLKEVFPSYDASMIISFLMHLEFCQKVTECEASIISGQRLDATPLKPEGYYYFAKLVTNARPDNVLKSILAAHYKCGWYLYRKHNHQFLMCRFLTILMLRLAFRFALPAVSGLTDAAGKKFKVWKNGVYWQSRDGIEALVEAVDVNQGVMVAVACPAGKEVDCVKLRSDIIRTILEAKKQYSAAVEMSENVVHPVQSQLALHPLKLPQSIEVSSISGAIENDSRVVECVTDKKKVDIDTLLSFEPYACLNREIVQRLFNPVLSSLEVSDDFLNKIAHVAYPWTKQFRQVLNVTDQMVASIHSQTVGRSDPVSHPVRNCFTALRAWKLSSQTPTHQSLREALDGNSVFAGRSPLAHLKSFDVSIPEDCSPTRTHISHKLLPVHSPTSTETDAERYIVLRT